LIEARSVDIVACWKVDNTILFKFNINNKEFIELAVWKCIKNIVVFKATEIIVKVDDYWI
jgi:hypothetical protein